MAYAMNGTQLGKNKEMMRSVTKVMKDKVPTYHEGAQKFIKGAKDMGYSVEGGEDEIIAIPPTKAKPISAGARGARYTPGAKKIGPMMEGTLGRAVKTVRGIASLGGKLAKKVITDPLNLEGLDRIAGK